MGIERSWSRADIAQHILDGETLVIYRNNVLRIPQSWLQAHPGGDLAILHFVGRDATDEVDAFHNDDTLKRVRQFIVGQLEPSDDAVWDPLLPPVHTGWVRRIGLDGKQTWYNEAQAVRSTTDTELSPSSQILLVEKSPSEAASVGPTLENLAPQPTSLSAKVQARHSAAYKQLHERITAAGLYQCDYLFGYGPEVVRYVLLATTSAFLYAQGWILLSAVFLGLFWHQLVFTAHDLGHMGVTGNWVIDRLLGIFIADFLGGLSIGWWVDNHNIHHLVTNHPSHDPDIEHLPFFAITPVFANSLWSSYYKRIFPFDAPTRLFISLQHKLFYVVMSLARFNLYRLSYGFLIKRGLAPMKSKNGRWSWALEVTSIIFFWCWFGAALRGCGSWQKALGYLLVSHVVTSPLHVQIVLSHFSRSAADLGPTESFPARQLRTTTDVICPPSLAFVHGGLHLQVTHHLFPRLPRHNLKRASALVKAFAAEQGLEYAEFGFVEGNAEVRGVLRSVAEQVKIVGMVAEGEVREAMARKNL